MIKLSVRFQFCETVHKKTEKVGYMNNSLIEMHGIGFVGVDDIDVVVDSNDGIDDNYHVGAGDGTDVDDVDEDDGAIDGNDGVDDHCHDGAVDGTDL